MRISIVGFRALAGALSAALLAACVSTSVVDSWRDPGYTGPPLHKLLVVGVQGDQGRRRVWEGAMVEALTHQELQATASYQVFPDKAPAPAELTALATREGFDGVVATHFVGASRRHYVMPGPYVGVGYGWRWRHYGYWDGLYGPGYVETEYRSDYQTDIFTVDAGGGKLIWSGVTRSVDLSSTRSTTDEIGRVLVPALTKQSILAGKK